MLTPLADWQGMSNNQILYLITNVIFVDDDRQYHGGVRVATALSLVADLGEFQKVAPHFDVPMKIIHGDRDRVTSHLGSLNFAASAGTDDAECTIYEGLEHIMFKVGGDEGDIRVRRAILQDRDDWFLERVALKDD